MTVLERGDISFFFRPAVQPAEAEVVTLGVQSFFFVLGLMGGWHRRVRVGRKRLPVAPGERLWAVVERVGSLQRVLADLLEDEHYTTKTRGERYQPGARLIARGEYSFVRHDDHTHLVYRVDDEELGPEVPDEVRVAPSGSYVVLWERVPRGRATWSAEGEPAMLDEQGAELVLVGHHEVEHAITI